MSVWPAPRLSVLVPNRRETIARPPNDSNGLVFGAQRGGERRQAHESGDGAGEASRDGMGRQNKKRAGNGSRRAKKSAVRRVHKPSSVPLRSSRTSGAVNIPLGSRLLCTSSEPTRRRSAGHRMDANNCAPVPPYLLLLQMGFAVPTTSLPSRCALTAPFHPCLAHPKVGRGGLFSVALSVGSPRLAVSQHHALWSSDFPLASSKVASVYLDRSEPRAEPSHRPP